MMGQLYIPVPSHSPGHSTLRLRRGAAPHSAGVYSGLSGRFQQCAIPADVRGVLRDVESARRWHELNGP